MTDLIDSQFFFYFGGCKDTCSLEGKLGETDNVLKSSSHENIKMSK